MQKHTVFGLFVAGILLVPGYVQAQDVCSECIPCVGDETVRFVWEYAIPADTTNDHLWLGDLQGDGSCVRGSCEQQHIPCDDFPEEAPDLDLLALGLSHLSSDEVAEFSSLVPGRIRVSIENSSIQILACNSTVLANLPISANMLERAKAADAPSDISP